MSNLSSTALGTLVTLLVGQMLTAAIFLIGFVPIMRRAVDKEIPAALGELKGSVATLNTKVDEVGVALGKLREDFIQFSSRSDERIKFLERRFMEKHE